MKTNKLQKRMSSTSENSNEETKLSRVLSNSNLNNEFWKSLRETIKIKKESESIKGRIFTAKRILTPIIQELMKDALKQIEADELEEFEGKGIKEKEIKVLYNNLKAADIWHVKKDISDGEEWAMRILREISRDFEQPFDELHGKYEKDKVKKQTSKDILLNETLLTKLVTIHQHLGNIIQRLNKRSRKERIVDTDDSLEDLPHQVINFKTSNSTDTRCSIPRKWNEHKNQPKLGYVAQTRSLSLEENRIQLKVEHACSVINLESIERAAYSTNKKLLFDVAVSYHALFEENDNNIGNKEIVIKCLEDLETVRTYLEAIRDNKECEKPKFCDLESCKNNECLESRPHLHSNIRNMPMVLKLNKHAEDNERNSDLIIGIPSLTKSSPDVHILLNTKDQHVDIKNALEEANRTHNQPKNSYRTSRIPKPIDKKRIHLEKFVKSKSMKITLENKEGSKNKTANLLIFDPNDPCKSIIKMKEQKNEVANISRPVVSNSCFTLTQHENLIIHVIFCCIGGSFNKPKANIGILFLFKRFLKVRNSSSEYKYFHIMELFVFILIFRISLLETEYMRKYLNWKIPEKKYYCFLQKNFWRKGSKNAKFSSEENLKCMHHLFKNVSLTKGFESNIFRDQNILYEKCIYRPKDFKKFYPWAGVQYGVYFFKCFKESKETKKRESSSQGMWNYQSLNIGTYPIWTIKRSKYYSVPQSKKKKTNEEVPKRVEEDPESSNLQLKLDDSLENLKESHNEIHLQISEVSLHSSEFPRVAKLESSDKMCQKTEIKRKVSFRDEVDISESSVDKSMKELDPNLQDYKGFPDAQDYKKPNSVEYTADRSPSFEMQEDIKELSTRISDLLMTDSLLQIAEDMPKYNIEKSKQESSKSSPKSLKLTDSARHILAKLSKSFEDQQYGSISGTLDYDIVPYFYDERGYPITEVHNSDGELLVSLKNGSVDRLTSVLFDSGGLLFRNRYDVNGRQIKVVYDENGRLVGSIHESNEEIKCVQADLEVIQYYDYRGERIKHIYDSSGYEIKTVGEDLTSKMFDVDGRLQIDIYTQRGRRIDAVYDSKGRLLGRVSYSQLQPLLRSEQVRVANVDDDSLSKLFESENKSLKFQFEDNKEQSKSQKRFFDQEGNPLVGVYNKKGKPLKITSSGKADELLPFLFDKKGKLQSNRYDSKGKELKAVFGEDGKAISEMSMAWLNELLSSSKNNTSKMKEKKSFFKKASRYKTKIEKVHDIEKLYDSDGKVITSVFDSKGKPLAVSLSGDAKKLLPFLFDKGGKFIKKRYDSKKRKLKIVYGKDGNIISAVSVTYLDSIAKKLICEQNQNENEDKAPTEGDTKNCTPDKEHKGFNGKCIKSNESPDYFEKIPDQLYDENGKILTQIFDHDGNLLKSSSSANAWKLLPHLFDDKGVFLKKRFDNRGKELLAVYNKEGDNLNNDLMIAIKVVTEKVLEYNKEPSDSNEEKSCVEEKEKGEIEEESKVDKNGEIQSVESKNHKIQNVDESKQRDSVLKLANTSSKAPADVLTKMPSKFRTTAKKSLTANQKRKEKHEKKQLKPTTSITMRRSVNQKFDIPEINLKAGESIHRFYDEKGNVITEVYDANGKVLIKNRTGEVEKLARFLFDKDGLLHENIYKQNGKRITRIFDQKKRSISRISVSSTISGINMLNKLHQNDRKLFGSVYDKNGFLVKEIYDRKGHAIIITKKAKLQDLAPIIFDEKGVIRPIYNKSGKEIGPIYDHKGNVLKRLPISKKLKIKQVNSGSRIFSKSGRPLRNFYDSDGTLIIALYNDYGKTLCSVKEGDNNVELLSKFFFDKDGYFLRGRFYNYRGQMIKHVYDSIGNIVKAIRRTESRKIAHHKSIKSRKEKVHPRKNVENTNKLNLRMNFNRASKYKLKGYHGKSEVRPIENIMGNFSSQSDTILNPEIHSLQRSMSTYSLRDNHVRHQLSVTSSSSSMSSLTKMSVKKFYDEDGTLLTGVYNSKSKLLGYSASGNARVLAPYLFDSKGNFISGRYNLERKPLKNVYDSNGKLVDEIPKLVLKTAKKLQGVKIRDVNGDIITSIYDLRGNKIFDITDSFEKIGNLLDKNGKFEDTSFYNYRGTKLELDKNYGIIRSKFAQECSLSDLCEDKSQKERLVLKDRVSTLSTFKDKILTVIFDNRHRICRKLPFQSSYRPTKAKQTQRTVDGGRSWLTKSHLYDKNLNRIKEIYDDRGKIINRVYNSNGTVMKELYSKSGTMVKNNVLKSMFEQNEFKPKVYNSEGHIITSIFANKKLLRRVYDEKGAPAKVDSDLIYLVSEQSLPVDDVPPPSKSAPNQVNYFSEGSTYPFPEGQNRNEQIQKQQLTEGKNYGAELDVAFSGYSSRITDKCTCDYCQKMGKNRRNIVQIGGELLDRLSRFTIPLTKFLPRIFLRREVQDDSEELEGEHDSLETLLDEVTKQEHSEETVGTAREYYGSCSRVSLLESDENIPISRKMVEKTLRKCVHLNSSTKVIGKVSDTVLQHFANLILQEIEQKFYHKLDILQCRRSSSLVLECDGEKVSDICIGTELKFEDSLIGKHISAQTIDPQMTLGHCFHLCGSSLEVLTRNSQMYEDFSCGLNGRRRECHKAFVCKVPNLQPFIVMMNTKMETLEKNIKKE